MSFTTVPVDITGPSYQSRSKPLSSQKTQNWYPQLTDEGKANYVLMAFPGLKYLSFTEGADRGANRMAEGLYQVKGTSLCKITSDGSHYLLGTIPGSKRCIFANDGINLFIVVPG